jgi:transcriptional repressor NrdR
MICPFCSEETKVLESRLVDNNVRRRRECLQCSNRFTTYEQAVFQLTVQKKNGAIQPFNLTKIASSLEKACNKADPNLLQTACQRIERKLLAKKRKQFTTKEIGKLALLELRKLDKIAYVRFATIHKDIDDPILLKKELSLIT